MGKKNLIMNIKNISEAERLIALRTAVLAKLDCALNADYLSVFAKQMQFDFAIDDEVGQETKKFLCNLLREKLGEIEEAIGEL
jgi:hypothetical protein